MSEANSFKGTEAAHRAYMRGYMRQRRAEHIRVTSHDVIVKASAYDIGRKEWRDGSGVLMWPGRCIGRDPSTDIAEVRVALSRRRRLRGGRHG
jgi:hypothetical protein